MKIRILSARLLLILFAFAIAGCNTAQPRTTPGKRLKLETIRHEQSTIYIYRSVDGPGGGPKSH